LSVGYILKYAVNELNSKFVLNILDLLDPNVYQLMIDPLTYEYYMPARMFFEVNNTV